MILAKNKADKLRLTLITINDKISRGAKDPLIVKLASQITAGKSKDGKIKAIADYVKERVRYVKDPSGIEVIQDARDTLRLGRGDCDDLTILISSLAKAGGLKARAKVVGDTIKDLSHIYPEVKGSRWHQVDLVDPAFFLAASIGSNGPWKRSLAA